MTAKLVDEVPASFSNIVDSISKDVYPAEVGLVVFKEEPVGEDEYEGNPDKNHCGKFWEFFFLILLQSCA